MTPTPEWQKSLLGGAEIVGFALNISALRAIYVHRLEKDGLSEEEIEAAYEQRRLTWRLGVLGVALVAGFVGYFTRPYSGLGTIMMYLALLLIAIQLNSKWIPSPVATAKRILNLKKETTPNER